MPKIQDYINNRHKYQVDRTYQRPAGAWTNEDRQCLIDTILKNEPMPLFFFNYKSDEKIYYIVDGQQRLDAIAGFYDNKIKLNKKFSGEENHGRTFNGENPISDDQRENILNYPLNFHVMEDYDDERIRLIFSRLQRGKPLTLGERLNACPGEIVLRMREIAMHPFMKDSIAIAQHRYGNYPDAARILFYEKYGAKDSGTPAILSFFDNHKILSRTDREYRRATTVLNFLEKCFPPKSDGYYFFSKHAWVFSVYTMVRDLIFCYSLHGEENKIYEFIEEFHNKVYSEELRTANPNYQRFYDNVRGGWSERIIALRRKILIDEFLKRYSIKEIDEKRQISEEEKIEIFEKQSHKCSLCDKKLDDYKNFEYHHIDLYAHGGETSIGNIIALCSDCHKRVHGKEKVEPPTVEELQEDENNNE